MSHIFVHHINQLFLKHFLPMLHLQLLMRLKHHQANEVLTEQEYEIYLFLIKYFKENGYAPTVREIGKGVYLGSTAIIKYYLDALERKKKIKRGEGARAICLTEYTLVHKKRVK